MATASLTRPLDADELAALASALLTRNALIEVAIVAACIGLAWAIAGLVPRNRKLPHRSIWLGDRVIDGVLFPVLAFVFALVARRVLEGVLPIAVFRIALPILLSLVIIRTTVRVLGAAFPNSPVMRAAEKWVSWIAWVGVVLWITGVLPAVAEELDQITWKLGDRPVSLRNLIEGVVSAVVVMVVALWVSAAIETRLLPSAIENLSLRKIAANATRALLLFVGLLFALSAAGLDLTALSVFGGALGVGIGLGLQKVASNYVSGFVVLAERQVLIGDMVKVDSFEGRVVDISTRYTVLRAINGRESIVPNEMLMIQRVENLTRGDPRIAVTTAVTIAHGSDVETLLPRLLVAVKAVPKVLEAPEPNVQLSAFTPDGPEITVQFWVADVTVNQGPVKSDVNRTVLRVLAELGIETARTYRFVRTLDAEGRPLPPDDRRRAGSVDGGA